MLVKVGKTALFESQLKFVPAPLIVTWTLFDTSNFTTYSIVYNLDMRSDTPAMIQLSLANFRTIFIQTNKKLRSYTKDCDLSVDINPTEPIQDLVPSNIQYTASKCYINYAAIGSDSR